MNVPTIKPIALVAVGFFRAKSKFKVISKKAYEIPNKKIK
jgi:hypothetical protein